jgi:hypothetical protein
VADVLKTRDMPCSFRFFRIFDGQGIVVNELVESDALRLLSAAAEKNGRMICVPACGILGDNGGASHSFGFTAFNPITELTSVLLPVLNTPSVIRLNSPLLCEYHRLAGKCATDFDIFKRHFNLSLMLYLLAPQVFLGI